MPQVGGLLVGRALPEEQEGRIAGDEMDHAEDDQRHPEEDEDHQQQSLADIRRASQPYLFTFTSSKR